MKVVGSIIARLGSKRLPYKNILPFNGKPMVLLAIETLKKAKSVDSIVVSTESELIARIAMQEGVDILQRPPDLAKDDTPSVPVFQHIMRHFEGDIHVNLNVNFPLCNESVIDRAVSIAQEKGESLSNPYAVWAQTRLCLDNYANPWDITAFIFEDPQAGDLDIHTEEDLLQTYRQVQGSEIPWIKTGIAIALN